MHVWISSSLVRHYPGSRARRRRALTLHAARGERVSFQVACRTEAAHRRITVSAAAPHGLEVEVRRVGYVPLRHFGTETPLEELEGVGHVPGLAPDPLLPEPTVLAGPFETNAFWISVGIPPEARPGRQAVRVTVSAEGVEPVCVTAAVVVHRAALSPRRDFVVTHWFYADALCDWYLTELWQESFWPILDVYLANLAAHGTNTTHLPAFTPPTDGVKRPTQLLGVSRAGDDYRFDWSLVRRWIASARASGLGWFEWNHLFTQWGVERALRVYAGHGETARLLWPPETAATSPTYREFLKQYLPQLKRFLDAEGLLWNSIFHLSDEPHGEQHRANYRAAREMMRELAPWMKITEAVSQIEFAREGLIDIPVPILHQAPQFVREGFPAWTYFCCGPRGRYLNRLMDTPLCKIRMAGWLFYRQQARGFGHWGYNYWYRSQTTQLIDPYQVNDGSDWPSLASGDPFQVYPGEAGPVDSLRWEVWAESLQDYALLQSAGLSPDDPVLAEIVDYADFPRDEAWIARGRQEALSRLDQGASA